MKIIELSLENFIDKDFKSPLRKISEEVIYFDDTLFDQIKDLKKVFDSYKVSVGLAAPQVGLNKRIIIINLNKQDQQDLIIINPIIISNDGLVTDFAESCLSLPEYKGNVSRNDDLSIEYLDLKGNKINLQTKGFLARVILHEIDHLNGILYTDRVNDLSSLEKVDYKWE